VEFFACFREENHWLLLSATVRCYAAGGRGGRPARAPRARSVLSAACRCRCRCIRMALAGTVFCISGSLSISKGQMTAKLAGAGATVAGSLTAKVTYLLSTAADVSKKTSKTVAAESKGLPVVAESFVDASLAKGQLVAAGPHLLIGGSVAAAAAPPAKKIAAAQKKKKRAAAAPASTKGSPAAKKNKTVSSATPVAPDPLIQDAEVATDDDGQFLEYQLSQMDIAKNVVSVTLCYSACCCLGGRGRPQALIPRHLHAR
jgi:hypothetical protein